MGIFLNFLKFTIICDFLFSIIVHCYACYWLQRRVCLCLQKESPCSSVTIQFCETSIRHGTCPTGMKWQLATATQTPLPSLSASLAIISELLSTSCSNRLKRRKRLENHNFTYSHHLLGVKELKPDMGEKGLWVLLALFEKERLCLLFQPPLPQDGIFTGLVTPLSWLLSTIQGMGRWFSTVNSLRSFLRLHCELARVTKQELEDCPLIQLLEGVGADERSQSSAPCDLPRLCVLLSP